MNEGDPGTKNQEAVVSNVRREVVGSSGAIYESVQVFNTALGCMTDHIISDGPQPATLAEGE